MAQVNPYAAPKAAVDDVEPAAFELATRWQRLQAAILDGIVIWIAIMIAALAGREDPTAMGVAVWIGIAAVAAINLWMVHRYRASIGKKALRIRMVRPDGSEAALWRLILLRGVPQWIVGAVPIINILSLVDVLFIFGRDRRCVHDFIGGTIVVKAK
ncbi:MAG: RDD family protein [Burkholderiales bacterium]